MVVIQLKRFTAVALLALMAACSSTGALQADTSAAGQPPIGSQAWYALVEAKFPTSDGHGHGPDYGSQEWCDVVYFRMHGKHAAEPVACDQQWLEFVDSQISK